MRTISKVLVLMMLVGLSSYSFANSAWSQFGNQNAGSYNRSGDSFSRGETLKSGDVIDAVVLSVREVTMEASNTSQNVGTGAGAAVGGVAGASMGKNTTTKTLGGLIGAIGGGVLGNMAGTAAGEDRAGELVLMLENGKRIFVVQKDGMRFKEGDRVFVLVSETSSGGYYGQKQQTIRVSPNNSIQ